MPIPTKETARRITQLLERNGEIGPARPSRGGSSGRIPVLVLCDSMTPADGSGVGAQCYPATVLDINSNETSIAAGAEMWLTVLGAAGLPVVPTVDTPYLGLLSGEVAPGGSGTSRNRVFAVEGGGGAFDLTVKESDGTPSLTGIHTIEFDQGDGYIVEANGTGVAKIRGTPTSGAITVGNVTSPGGGATADHSTTVLKAANSTGSMIRDGATSGDPSVHEILEAYLAQWGAVTDNDQRVYGDKRIVHTDAGGGKGWGVASFADTRASIWPGGYTAVATGTGNQLYVPQLDVVPGGNTYFWSENRSFGVAFKVDSEADDAIPGRAYIHAFVPPKNYIGESFNGLVVSAAAGDKTASVIVGAGLVTTDDSGGFNGYYPAFHMYVAGDSVLWVGADETSTHKRIGMTRGKPGDRADGLLEWHFRPVSWEPEVPGETEEDEPTPAVAEGDMLISRLHIGMDDASGYPGTPRAPMQGWPTSVINYPSINSAESGLRYWVKREGDGQQLFPGIDYDFSDTTSGGAAGQYMEVPIVRGGIVVGTLLNETFRQLWMRVHNDNEDRIHELELQVEDLLTRVAALEAA